MSTLLDLAVVIVEFKSWERTVQYVQDAFEAIHNATLRFIIVDNSCDYSNSKHLIEELRLDKENKYTNLHFQCIRTNALGTISLIITNANDGFAKANNYGLEYISTTCKSKYVLFSNNDIQFDVSFDIEKMVKCFNEDPSIAVVGPKVIGIDGKRQSPCRKVNIFNRWWKFELIWPFGHFLPRSKRDYYSSKSDLMKMDSDGKVYRILGAFMLCETSKILEVGGFDENTFLYAEEPILSERLLTKGWTTYYCNEVEITHEGGHSTKKSFSDIKKLKLRFNSEMYYYRTYCNISPVIISITRIIFNIYVCKYRLFSFFHR